MRLRSLFGKKSKKDSQPKYYDSIHNLPQWNFNKIHETQNLTFLEIRDRYNEKDRIVNVKLWKLWEQINDELHLTFGVTDQQETILELKRRRALLVCDLIINDDRSKKTFIEIKDAELAQEMTEGEKAKFHESVTAMEKYMSYKIEPKGVTVYDYQRIYRDILNSSTNGKSH